MNDDLERILRQEPLVTPSIGFTRRTMQAVRRARGASAPIAFPLPRSIIGLAVASLLSAGNMLLPDLPGNSALVAVATAAAASLLVIRICLDTTTQ